MIIPDTLHNTVKLYPHKEAIICGDQRFTYLQFSERIAQLAGALRALGVVKGRRVAALHWNCHVYLELLYAAAQVGAILVPLNTRLAPAELAFMLEDSGSDLLFAERGFQDKVQQIRSLLSQSLEVVWTCGAQAIARDEANKDYEELLASATADYRVEESLTPEDVAQIFYTSGSTGRPKGVLMTHNNMTWHAMGTLWEYQISDRDVWGHLAAMFHMSDVCNAWSTTWAGATHVLVDRFDVPKVVDIINRQRLTVLKLVPTMWTMLLNHPAVKQCDFSSLRLAVSGGAPISPTLIQQIIETCGCEYVQNYGMTESTHFLTISRLKDSLLSLPYAEQLRYRSKTGRPFIGIKLRVVDEQGNDVTPDGEQVGEILVRGDTITPGYWNLPEENQRAFENGWLRTGDLATLDQEGYVQVVDRKKDMIVSGGENIYCVEVENILCRHPGVVEAAVVGVPDDKWGEAVKAVCVVKEDCSLAEQDLISACKEQLAHYKAPKSVDFVEALPKTGSGKIDKKVLRRRYHKDPAQGPLPKGAEGS